MIVSFRFALAPAPASDAGNRFHGKCWGPVQVQFDEIVKILAFVCSQLAGDNFSVLDQIDGNSLVRNCERPVSTASRLTLPRIEQAGTACLYTSTAKSPRWVPVQHRSPLLALPSVHRVFAGIGHKLKFEICGRPYL